MNVEDLVIDEMRKMTSKQAMIFAALVGSIALAKASNAHERPGQVGAIAMANCPSIGFTVALGGGSMSERLQDVVKPLKDEICCSDYAIIIESDARRT
jgi:hypothetical protein